MSGPLTGVRVVEFAGIGPTPFAAMMLADMGAEVLRIDRSWPPASPGDPALDYLRRGRPAIVLDLKSEAGLHAARSMTAQADVIIEGFRPGVMERLGLAPDDLAAENPRLIYARMTGWGQTGPLAHKAGHDINYLALTGGLHMMGSPDHPPVPPINFIGDYGGGGMFVVAGILAALLARQRTGCGQVIDAAMIDGATMLMTQIFSWSAMGVWRPERGSNLLDGGAYFYRCYRAKDGKFIAVGALEPQFHDELLHGLGFKPDDFTDRMDRSLWATRTAQLAAAFSTRTRDEWVVAFEPFDACVTPVLTMAEAAAHPANRGRNVHVNEPAGIQPAFAPRLSDTPGIVGAMPGVPGVEAAARLENWGFDDSAIRMITGLGEW